MKNLIRGLGVASLLALGTAGVANADPMSMATSWVACNTGYAQCLAAADMTLAMSPAEGMAKLQANTAHAQACAAQAQACYSAVQ